MARAKLPVSTHRAERVFPDAGRVATHQTSYQVEQQPVPAFITFNDEKVIASNIAGWMPPNALPAIRALGFCLLCTAHT